MSDAQTYTVAEAAALLGVTPEVVRKRLQRGKLAGAKGVDGRWLVTLDTPARTDPDAPGPSWTSARTDPDIAGLREELARVTAERDAAIAERDRLWQMLSGTLGRLLPRPGETLPAETQTPSEPRRWWQVWR